MARTKSTTHHTNIQQETLFGPHQYSLFTTQKVNPYEERQKARKKYYEHRAAVAREQAIKESDEGVALLKVLPPGQPILVGHHSEQGHRTLVARSDNKMRQSIKNDEKVNYYEAKAESVGKNGISSDDPQVIEKLEKKLKTAEAKQERMKAANTIIRKNPEDKDSLMALGFSEKESEELIHPPRWMSSTGFPSYALTNNLSKMRLAQAETVEIVKNGYTLRHDTEENRIMFILDGKPSSEIKTILKKYAFKWSPRRGAWIRQATANGIFAARHARKELDTLKG